MGVVERERAMMGTAHNGLITLLPDDLLDPIRPCDVPLQEKFSFTIQSAL